MTTQDAGHLYILRIEIDGHFHGSKRVPRPWVARIDGVSERFGLRRTFVRALNDWRGSRKAWSGNTYGVVATFPLRQNALYEVCRLYGSSSKRRIVRNFYWLEEGEMRPVSTDAALTMAASLQEAECPASGQ